MLLNQLLEEFNIKINGEEEKIILKNKNLDDKFVKYLSEIYFENLKKLDISDNKIEDIKYLEKMKLDKLQILNVSKNKIKDIEFFKDMELKNLEELYLQENKIQNIKALLETSFSKIKSLRIENNDINKELPQFREFLNKYDKVLLNGISIEEFNRNYECNISLESQSIDFADMHLGDKLIKDFSVINKKFEYLIKLNLRNNKIKDISPLSTISFKLLKSLDLSVNKIVIIDSLEEMNLENLEKLYLSDNLINNICPLKYFESKNLKQLDLKNNKLHDENYKKKNDEIIISLKRSLDYVDY